MIHKTVLLNEAINGLAISGRSVRSTSGTARGTAEGDQKPHPAIIVDATINGGGHSARLIELYGSSVEIIGIDLDQDALDRADKRLSVANEHALRSGLGQAKYVLHCTSFRHLKEVVKASGIEPGSVDGILFDLGLSSNQFEDSGRGFSFQKDEPLLMSFKKDPDEKNGELTAYEIVNTWDEQNLADIIYGYGEERFAKRIARQLVADRQDKPIKTTFELVEAIRKAVPFIYTKGRIHFATKTFQALRITVNDEIQSLREVLVQGMEVLKGASNAGGIGGRMAVISFHSIEDRIVKRFFQEQRMAGRAAIITKKPIVPSDMEVADNRRSRSAKLRILEKIK